MGLSQCFILPLERDESLPSADHVPGLAHGARGVEVLHLLLITS